MVCYMCDQEGKSTPAVAICIVCGMGLCREHAVREELPVWETLHLGMGQTKRKMPLTMPRFLCRPCYRALHQKET